MTESRKEELLGKVAIGFLASASGFFSTTTMLYRYMMSEIWNERAKIHPIEETVSVVMASLNEESTIENALLSLRRQNVLREYEDLFEFILVDSYSTDRTVELAEPYVDRIIFCEPGKLTAKDKGIREAKGEIIVNVDADSFYPPNFLNLLLRHFREPSVVAVGSPRLVAEPNLIGVGYVWKAIIDFILNNRLPGSSSAFRRQAYFEVGGYDLSINQFDRAEIVQEEEVNITNKLKTIGKVKFDLKAPCLTSPRFWYCFAPEIPSEETYRYCATVISGERF